MQQRVYNFGDTLTQGKTKTLASRLLSAGVYEGVEPVIVSDVSALINLTPGAFLMPNGVLVVESTTITNISYPVSWPPAGAADFTLTADHDDVQAIGGSPVSYTIRAGNLPASGSPFPNSLALLRIRFPGSAALNQGMFSVPLKVKNGALLDYILTGEGWSPAPFPNACNVVAGPNVIQKNTSFGGPENQGVLVYSTAAFNSQTFQFTIPIPRMPWARRVEVYADLPASSSIGFNTLMRTFTAPAPVGTNVTVSVDSIVGFAVGDIVVLRDPSTGLREVTSIKTVYSGTGQFGIDLRNSYTLGTQLTSASVVTAETGEVLPTNITSVSGPVSGLGPIPAAVFEIGSGPKPATLGLRIVVPPGGVNNGVFIRGFQFIGD